jgi:hypothetical protein
MADVQELEHEVDGVGEVVSTETDPSTAADAAATRQPEKVNLDGFKEFREYKSAQDRRISQIERTHQQQLAQARAEAQQIRQQFEQNYVGNMDDEQRAAYVAQQATTRAEAAERRLYELDMQAERSKVLQDIAERYEVPVAELAEATDPGHARDLAWEYQKRKKEEQATMSDAAVAERQAKRAANKVDVGSGAPVTPATELDKQFANAKKNKNTKELFRLGLSMPN